MKRVFVSNIPIRTVVAGWVEVPDDWKERPDAHVAQALKEAKYTIEDRTITIESDDLDFEDLEKWEFDFPVESF